LNLRLPAPVLDAQTSPGLAGAQTHGLTPYEPGGHSGLLVSLLPHPCRLSSLRRVAPRYHKFVVSCGINDLRRRERC